MQALVLLGLISQVLRASSSHGVTEPLAKETERKVVSVVLRSLSSSSIVVVSRALAMCSSDTNAMPHVLLAPPVVHRVRHAVQRVCERHWSRVVCDTARGVLRSLPVGDDADSDDASRDVSLLVPAVTSVSDLSSCGSSERVLSATPEVAVGVEVSSTPLTSPSRSPKLDSPPPLSHVDVTSRSLFPRVVLASAGGGGGGGVTTNGSSVSVDSSRGSMGSTSSFGGRSVSSTSV
jgi:hypothetical protein